ARLEDELDAISRGELDWVPLMKDFWRPFKERVDEKDANVSRRDVAKARELGIDPKSGRIVSVRMGRYGPFVQMGMAEDEEKPKFASLRPGQSMHEITLEEALSLFNLPRDLGETALGEPMMVAIGRFGPYVKFGSKYASLGKEDDPYTISRERALELVEAKRKADAEREIQIFEDAGIKVLNGRYGPYVTDGKKNAKVPKERDPKSLTLEECQTILKEAPAKGARRGGARKSATGRTTSRKAS
ncbi:MAG: DNA topoisomerase I, partial [Gammaproteobacteria bacterium]|nr:DNA topoisomerase I [Gammaproteobacteria bacterium]